MSTSPRPFGWLLAVPVTGLFPLVLRRYDCVRATVATPVLWRFAGFTFQLEDAQ
jgi:hypothetical protein